MSPLGRTSKVHAVLSLRSLADRDLPTGLAGLSNEEITGFWLAGRVDATASTYARALARFAEDRGISIDESVGLLLRQPLKILQDLMDAYALSLAMQGYASSSIRINLASLQSLIQWARSNGLPGAVFRQVGIGESSDFPRRRPVEVVGPRFDLDLFLSEADQYEDSYLSTSEGQIILKRDVAIISLLHDSRLTIETMVGIALSDLGIADGSHTHILVGDQSLVLSRRASKALSAWVDVREWCPGAEGRALFPGPAGTFMTSRGMRASLVTTLKRFGILSLDASAIREIGLRDLVQRVFVSGTTSVRGSRTKALPVLDWKRT